MVTFISENLYPLILSFILCIIFLCWFLWYKAITPKDLKGLFLLFPILFIVAISKHFQNIPLRTSCIIIWSLFFSYAVSTWGHFFCIRLLQRRKYKKNKINLLEHSILNPSDEKAIFIMCGASLGLLIPSILLVLPFCSFVKSLLIMSSSFMVILFVLFISLLLLGFMSHIQIKSRWEKIFLYMISIFPILYEYEVAHYFKACSAHEKNKFLKREIKKDIVQYFNYFNLALAVLIAVITLLIMFIIPRNPIILILLYFVAFRIIGRSVEIIRAFFKDVVDKEPKETNLTSQDRILLAVLSFLEMTVLYAVLYSLLEAYYIHSGGIICFVHNFEITSSISRPFYHFFKEVAYSLGLMAFRSEAGQPLLWQFFSSLQIVTSMVLIVFSIAKYMSGGDKYNTDYHYLDIIGGVSEKKESSASYISQVETLEKTIDILIKKFIETSDNKPLFNGMMYHYKDDFYAKIEFVGAKILTKQPSIDLAGLKDLHKVSRYIIDNEIELIPSVRIKEAHDKIQKLDDYITQHFPPTIETATPPTLIQNTAGVFTHVGKCFKDLFRF